MTYYVNNQSILLYFSRCFCLHSIELITANGHWFCLLLKHKLPSVTLCMLYNNTTYVSHRTRVEWNGVWSDAFNVLNGVKQGGNVSPIMFCIYIDDLLHSLAKSEVGCFVGNFFVGALAYADDTVLLAPSATATRAMLNLCDEYTSKHSFVFNSSKSRCMLFTPKWRAALFDNSNKPVIYINRICIDYANQWPHLRHYFMWFKWQTCSFMTVFLHLITVFYI